LLYSSQESHHRNELMPEKSRLSSWSAETEKKLVQEQLNHEEQLLHLGHLGHLLEYQPRQEAK